MDSFASPAIAGNPYEASFQPAACHSAAAWNRRCFLLFPGDSPAPPASKSFLSTFLHIRMRFVEDFTTG